MRMKERGGVREIVPWREARRFFYWRLRYQLFVMTERRGVTREGDCTQERGQEVLLLEAQVPDIRYEGEGRGERDCILERGQEVLLLEAQVPDIRYEGERRGEGDCILEGGQEVLPLEAHESWAPSIGMHIAQCTLPGGGADIARRNLNGCLSFKLPV